MRNKQMQKVESIRDENSFIRKVLFKAQIWSDFRNIIEIIQLRWTRDNMTVNISSLVAHN